MVNALNNALTDAEKDNYPNEPENTDWTLIAIVFFVFIILYFKYS